MGLPIYSGELERVQKPKALLGGLSDFPEQEEKEEDNIMGQEEILAHDKPTNIYEDTHGIAYF